MSPSRLLPLWLLTAAALATACSNDTTDPDGDIIDAGDGDGGGTGKKDSGGGDGDGDGDVIGDGDGDVSPDAGHGDGGGPVDSGPDACVPKGCDELGFTCGAAKDNCGNDLNCEPAAGDPCEGFNTCGGDATKPNQCGCTPKTCADLGAACGTDIDDGCGGTITSCGLGNCLTEGNNYICAADKSACQCVPLSENTACENFACGAVSNGCDTQTISCGTCTGNKTCVVAGGGASSSCQCDLNNAAKKLAACGTKTCGTATTADGCVFTCGAACATTCPASGSCAAAQNCTCQSDGAGGVPDQVCYQNLCCTVPVNAAAACGSQGCGEVTVCGVTFKCGNPATGACVDATKGCSYPDQAPWYGYNKQTTVNVPTCIPKNQADLLGTYRVRTHAFRATRSGGSDLINRSEALSIVTIEIDASGDLRLRDYGCYTTGIDFKNGNPSIAPNYYNLPELNVNLDVPANPTTATWERPAGTIAAGFINSRPASHFCSAAGAMTNNAAVDYNTQPNFMGLGVTAQSGARKIWLGDQKPPAGTPTDERADQVCTCPANGADWGALPAENTSSSTSGVTDCRIDDPDADSKPGFSIIANSGGVTLNVAAASLSVTEWWGNIDPNGRHYGFGAISDTHDRSVPLSRKFLSCGGTFGAGLLCAAAPGQVDWGCGAQYDLVLFERIPNTRSDTYDTFAELKAACSGPGKYYTNTPATNVGQIKTVLGEFGPSTSCTITDNCRSDEICKAGKCWPMTTAGACDGASCRKDWVCGFDKACWPDATLCTKP